MKIWNCAPNLLACVLALSTSVRASGDAPEDAQALADPNSAVVKLTKDTFDSFVAENPLVLAEFYAPWCGYCKMIGPELVKVANALNETHPGIKIAQIDCTEEEELCSKHEIRGYPTMKIARQDAKKLVDFNGPRDSDGISAYMIKQSLPAILLPESIEDVKALLNSTVVVEIGVPTKEQKAIFAAIAEAGRDQNIFVLIPDSKISKALLKLLPKVKPAKSGATYVVVLEGSPEEAVAIDAAEELTEKSLNEYIVRLSIPMFGDINRDTYTLYMQSTDPLAYYFYTSEKEREKLRPFFTKLAQKHRGKLNFVGLDSTKFGRHAETLNMDPEVFPLFAIDDTVASKKYGVSQAKFPKGPTEKAIAALVEDFVAGKASPIIKSEELPTEEEIASTAVCKLVGHNYEEIVGDVTKDILVEYYAPWCGHCKKLAPVWEELAAVYKDNNATEVVVAQCDHTANSIGGNLEIAGYPTIMLFKANSPVDPETGFRTPVVFTGAREIGAFMDFIKEEGAHAVDAAELIAENAGSETEEAVETAKEAESETEEAVEIEEEEIVGHDEL